VVRDALHGLGAAHAAGVIHRDLKPENIMMNADGEPILVDFGIAKTGKGNRPTQTGVLLGTPYYMSPEQITGKEVQVQSDLYSMGVVLYELLTANVPFQADSTFMITCKHCTEAPPPPRKLNEEISEDLQLVVLKSLEKDLRKRYQNASEFAEDLDKVLGGGKVEIEVSRRRDIYEITEFKQGMEHFRQKEFEAARELFQQVVDAAPEDEIARDYLQLSIDHLKMTEAGLNTGSSMVQDSGTEDLGADAVVEVCLVGTMQRGTIGVKVDSAHGQTVDFDAELHAGAGGRIQRRIEVPTGHHALEIELTADESVVGTFSFERTFPPGSSWTLRIDIPPSGRNARANLFRRER
jgi:hypothetical protein